LIEEETQKVSARYDEKLMYDLSLKVEPRKSPDSVVAGNKLAKML